MATFAPSDNGVHDTIQWPPDTAALTDELADAVAVARQAQRQWAAQPLRQRLKVLRRIRYAIVTQAETLAACVPPWRSRAPGATLAAEILPLLEACRFLERQAPRLLAPQRWSRRTRPLWLWGVELEVRREPLGVVLVITAANYPLFLPGVQMLQALTAGNAVVLKPGIGGGAAAQALAHCCFAAGLERALLHVLPESATSAQVAMDTGVDKVLLTGSAATGAVVLAALAPHLTPAVLELSGCDAAFVGADADLELVVRALTFSWQLNGGATCIAPRRVFVARPLAAALAVRLQRLAQAIAPCPTEATTTATVQELVREACEQGARLLAGDFFADGHMTPVVITDALPTMRLLQADLLAPVLALVAVDNDDEALAAAALCPYALGVTIFAQEARARALAARVQAGVVVINDVIVPTADPRLPFGGRRHSGFGVTRGAEGLLELTAVKAITVRHGRWRPHYEPLRPRQAAFLHTYMTLAHGKSWREWLGACLASLRHLRRP